MKLVADKSGEASSPLDQLAGRIEGEQRESAPVDPAAAQAEEEGRQAFEAMVAKFGVFVGKALKAVRSGIARKLPEIREQWTDEDLQAFADAIPPVAMKYLGKLGPLVADYPEECALVLAAAPLVAGYVGAVSAHSERVVEGVARAPAAAPPPITPAGAPPAGEGGTPVFHVG